jgi:glucan endo-1,3-alpha-glucosidase
MRLFRCLGLYCITSLLLTACSPAAQTPKQALKSAPKMVFAHFMLANQNDVPDDADSELVIASYERQIHQAQAIGIDGFALNAGGWFKEPRYIRRSAEMFEAAYRLHSGFKLFFSIDMCCSNDAEDAEDMIRRFANNPRYADLYFKQNGKVVVTAFAGNKYGPAFWQQLRHDLEQGSHPSTRKAPDAIASARGVPSSTPLPIFLVPAFFWGGELPRASDIETGLQDYASIIDGAFYWGIAGVPGLGHAPDQIPSSDAYGAALQHAGKLYMAPICFQFWGANAGRYYEYRGFSGMRDMWMHAIRVSHPEWVEIITWNDFIEGTFVSPIDDPAKYPQANDLGASAAPPATLHYFHSHRGATELLAYFIQWYKTGVEPPLHHDSIFWAYRTQLLGQNQAAIKLYGPVADVVYVTANLTAPAVLHVSFGDVSWTVSLPAGSSDVQVAIPSGDGQPPVFALTRAAAHLAQGRGEDPISTKSPYPNLYYPTGSMRD